MDIEIKRKEETKMEDKTKKAMGKLYEKYRVIKEFPSQLEVAIAHNSENGQEEVWIVWCNPLNEDQKMPLAHLMTDSEMSTKITPDFTRSFIAKTLFDEYRRFDTRLTVEEMDEQLEVDPNYDNMIETYDGAIDTAEKIMNGIVEEDIENMFDDLEKILNIESKKDE
jgi:hypothetical protein